MPRLGLLVAVLAASASAQPDALRATLDLRQPIADGWLDPATEAVGLRGDRAPLSWGATLPAADPDGDGLYALAVPFALDGDSLIVELKIKVDGADNPNGGWQEGENHRVVVRRGGTDLALAWGDRVAPPPGVVTGRVETIEGVEGAGLGPRAIHVWLPPGYDAEPERRYPVLYLHDGDGVFGTQPGAEWGMDEAATALLEAGEIEPVILVGVANTDRRTDEYTPTRRQWRRVMRRTGPPTGVGPLATSTGAFASEAGEVVVLRETEGGLVAEIPGGVSPVTARPDGTYHIEPDITVEVERDADGLATAMTATRPPAGGLGDAYGRLLTDTVKPLVDGRYRTLPDAAHTGLGGSSLGGLITMHLGITRPDVFGRLLVASPSVWWDDGAILDAVAAATPPPGQRVWVDIGTDEGDSMVPDARRLAALLVETGWDAALVRYVEAEGARHSTRAWAERAPDMLRFLFPAE
jgi:predicted alpha/beta superfamily hydrolase